jgi:hypothetical protein
MPLLDDVKVALRVTNAAYNDEISGLIAAAQEDLIIGGVSAAAAKKAEPDPLLKAALIVYCKAEFGLDNPDRERYQVSYQSMKNALALSAEYKQPKVSGLTGTISAGSALLTVSDVSAIEEDTWLSVAGAGADGALLIGQVIAIDDDVVTITRVASTTVEGAAVKLL